MASIYNDNYNDNVNGNGNEYKVQRMEVPEVDGKTPMADFYRQYMEAPEAAQDEERRLRSAAALGRIKAGGRLVGALANLAGVAGGGTQSVGLPTYQQIDYSALRDKGIAARRQYQAGLMAAMQQDEARQKQQQAERQQALNYNLQVDKYNLDYARRMEELEWKIRTKDRELEIKMEEALQKRDLNEAKIALAEAQKNLAEARTTGVAAQIAVCGARVAKIQNDIAKTTWDVVTTKTDQYGQQTTTVKQNKPQGSVKTGFASSLR